MLLGLLAFGDVARDPEGPNNLLVGIAVWAFGGEINPCDAIDLGHFFDGVGTASAHDLLIAPGDGIVAIVWQQLAQAPSLHLIHTMLQDLGAGAVSKGKAVFQVPDVDGVSGPLDDGVEQSVLEA